MTDKKVPSFTFRKPERLTQKTLIAQLFSEGDSLYLPPLKIIYLKSGAPPNQVLFAVSKRNFKKAVDRNLLKRRMREAYRLNKHHFEDRGIYFRIAYIYVGKEIASFHSIEDKLRKGILRLNELNS